MNNHQAVSERQPGERPRALSQIAGLNDALRQTGQGGRVYLSAGVAALPRDQQSAVLAAVAAFEAFTPDNDPHGEHDFGLLRITTHQVIFKIDYFDLALTMHSPDPADPSVTCRVLTIMLAEEY